MSAEDVVTCAGLQFTYTAEFRVIDVETEEDRTGCGIMSTSHQALAQQVCQQR